jgi:hypothetical protein
MWRGPRIVSIARPRLGLILRRLFAFDLHQCVNCSAVLAGIKKRGWRLFARRGWKL